MRHHRATAAIITAALFALLARTGAIAQSAAADNSPTVLDERLYKGISRENYVERLLTMLRNADRDGDGLDTGDIALQKARTLAGLRATEIGYFLRSDLDGNLKISRTEMDRALRGNSEARTRDVEAQFTKYDANADDTITLQEVAAKAVLKPRSEETVETKLFALDPNADGRLTIQELRTLAEQRFDAVDINHDGLLSEISGHGPLILPRISPPPPVSTVPSF